MVSRKEYKRKSETYWKTVIVRTLVDMQNGLMKIPKGTVCKIYRKRDGFSLSTEACKLCGVSILISKVRPEDVAVVSVDGKGFSMGV